MKQFVDVRFLFVGQLLFWLLFSPGAVMAAQHDTSTAPYVKWVAEYPEHVMHKNDSLFIVRLFNLITGRKTAHSRISRPVAVYAESPGDILVADQLEQSVLSMKGRKIRLPACERKKPGNFSSLIGLCRAGNKVLFTDSRQNKVFAMDADFKKYRVFGDTGGFKQPTGIACSEATGEVWIVETGLHRISIYSKEGMFVKTIGQRGAEAGQFNYPTSIWIDKNGDAYVVDAMNFRVQIFDKTGKFITMFGELGDGSGYFARPKGIAVDQFGNIYVADAQFQVVQIFDRAGNFLYRFGSAGSEKGQFLMPEGIYIDDKNYIYVADAYNSRIQVFQLINGS